MLNLVSWYFSPLCSPIGTPISLCGWINHEKVDPLLEIYAELAAYRNPRQENSSLCRYVFPVDSSVCYSGDSTIIVNGITIVYNQNDKFARSVQLK